jgi:protein arginine N-methyltransferase 1
VLAVSIYKTARMLRCHRECLDDHNRTESYQRAIAETVKPGDVVLDVGTGTGILAFMACQSGASKVYAIDPDEIIAHAEQISLVNGFQDRVVFVKDQSSDAMLPERADVLIAGHIHNFALETGLLSSLLDARKRLLKESPRFIPREIELSIVPVESPDMYYEIDFWKGRLYGFDFSAARKFAANCCFKAAFDSTAFLSSPQRLFRIDSATIQSVFLSGHVSCVANRTGLFHGIGGWFRAKLSGNVELSNDPRNTSANWAQIFFPLTSPIPVSRDDRIEMTVSTNDGNLWRWKVQAGTARSDQSTVFNTQFTKQQLIKQSPDFRPKLSGRGEATLFLLSEFKGNRSAAEIQEEFLQRYSGNFASVSAALGFHRRTLDLCSE